MRPGTLFLRLLGGIAAFSLLVPVAAWLVWAVAAALAIITIAAASEVLALRRVTILLERPAKVALALDENEIVPIRLQTSARRPLHLIFRQRWPELVQDRATVREGLCRAGEVLALELPVRAVQRGTEAVERSSVAITFRGLFERVVPAGGPSEISVLPNLKAVKRLHKQLNQFALRGIGARAAPRLGKGREFDRLRDYMTDDDYRDIAWRASARHGRLIVREFRLDRSQEILVCLDQGHRMAARVAQITRLDYAVNAAVLLGYICNRMEDRVGILSFDTETDKGLPPGRGTAHLRMMTEYVTDLTAAYRHTDYLALATNLRRRLSHRTLILILTVLPERDDRFDLLRAVEMLAPQHLPLLVVMKDPILEAAAHFLPAGRAELARTLVARELWMGRAELIRDLRARGALVVESTPEDAGIDGVNAYIDVKRRQLL